MSDLLKRLGMSTEQGSEVPDDAAKVAGEMRNAEEAAQQLESDPDYPYKTENLSPNEQMAQANSMAGDPVDDILAFQRARRERSSKDKEGKLIATLDPELMNSVHNSGVRNWWNSFNNAIDEIDKLRYSGEMLKFQKQIDELEQQKSELLNADTLTPNVQEQLKNIELQLASIRSDGEYHSTYADMKRQMKDIETSPISKNYEMKQQAIAEQEMSNPLDWLRYDAPIDLGGSASEMGTQLGAAVGISVARNLLLGAASGSAGGPVGAVVGGVIGVAATLGSTYATYKMREHESSAEMYGAFEEKLGKMTTDFVAQHGRQPDEDEMRKMRLDAYKGLDSVYKQNMNLMAGDALDILLMAAPWTRSLNALKIGAKMGKFSLAGARLGQATASTLSEALEEADQYGITQQYIAGTLQDNQTWSQNLMDNIATRVKNMRYLAGDVNEEWQMDAEFRNSMRAGGILGGIMGGGSNVIAAGNSIFNPPVTTSDIKGNIKQWLEPSETLMKGNMYSKFFERGDEVYMFSALRGLKDQKIEGVTSQDIDGAIETAERAYKTWQSIKPSGGVAASLTNKQKGVVFREKWAVEEGLRKAKKGQIDHQTNVLNPLITQIKAEVGGETVHAADATVVQNKVTALRSLKDQMEVQFPGIKEDPKSLPKSLQEYYQFLKRRLKVTEKLLDDAYKDNPELSTDNIGSTVDSQHVDAEVMAYNNNRQVIDYEKRSKKLNKQLSTLEGVREFFKDQTKMAENAVERNKNSRTKDDQKGNTYEDLKGDVANAKKKQEGGVTEMDIAMAMAGEAWGQTKGETTKTETQTPEQAEAENSAEIGTETTTAEDPLGKPTDTPPGAEFEGGATPAWGENNIYTTKESYEAALKSLKGKAFAGIPPEAFTIVAYHLEAGAREIAEVAKKVIEDFKRLDMDTPENRNAVKKAYAGTLVDPVLAEEYGPMTSFEEVKAFDIQNFDKGTAAGESEIGPGLTTKQTTALGRAKAALDALIEKMNNNLAEMTYMDIYDMLMGVNFIQEKYNEYSPKQGFDPDEFGMDEDYVLSFPHMIGGALFEQMESTTGGIGSKDFNVIKSMFGKFVQLLQEGVFSDEEVREYNTKFAEDWADAHSRRGRHYVQEQRYRGQENDGGFARTTMKQTEGELARNIEGIGEIVWDENAGTTEDPSYRQLFMPLRDENGDRVVAKAVPDFEGGSTFNEIYTTDEAKSRNGSPVYFIYVPKTQQIGGRTVATEVNYNGEYRHDTAVEVGPDGIPRERNLSKAEADERFNKIAVYELPAAVNAVPVTEIYETQDMDGVKILSVNTPAVMQGDDVVIFYEPNWEYYKTDKNDHANKVLNVYRASQIVNGEKMDGAQPLAAIPIMDRVNVEDVDTVAIRERFANNTSPLYLKIGKKSNGVTNFQYEDEQGVRHSISNATAGWYKNEDGTVTPKPDILDEPIFALGWSTDNAGGLRLDNESELSDKQLALVEHGDNENANLKKIPKTLQAPTTPHARYESGRVYVFMQQPDGSWRAVPTNRRKLNQTEINKITSGTFLSDQFQGYSQKLHKNRLGKLTHLVPTSLIGHHNRTGMETEDANSGKFVSDGLNLEKWRGYAVNFTAKGILIDMGDGYLYEVQITSNKKTGKVYDNISRLFDPTFQPDDKNWFTVKKIDVRTGKYVYKKKNGKADYYHYIKDVNEIRKLRETFINHLSDRLVSIDAKLINTKQKFADPIEEGVTHDTYYQYIQAREMLSLQTPAFEPATGAQIFLDYAPEADESVPSKDATEEGAKDNEADKRTEDIENPPPEKAETIEAEEEEIQILYKGEISNTPVSHVRQQAFMHLQSDMKNQPLTPKEKSKATRLINTMYKGGLSFQATVDKINKEFDINAKPDLTFGLPYLAYEKKKGKVKSKKTVETEAPTQKLDYEIPGEWVTREYTKPAPGYAHMSQEELQYLQDTVGEGAISIARGVDHVMAGGKKAWGFFSNAVTYLAERAEEGTAYHEAWHHVFRMALTPKQRAEVLNSAREKDERYSGIKDDYELEELMAEDFRDYMLHNRPPRSSLLRRVFRYLKRMINAIAGKTATFDEFHKDLAEGNFFQSELKEENLRLTSPLKQPRLIELTTEDGKPLSNNHTIQRKLVNHANWVFQNVLTDKVGGIHASKKSIDALITDSKMVDKLIAVTRNRIIEEINELSAQKDVPKDKIGRHNWKILALTEMVADENWDSSGTPEAPLEGFADIIRMSLRNIGYTVKIKYQVSPTRQSTKIGETSPSIEDMEQVAADETDDNSPETKDRVHDLETFLKSKKDTMSAGLRQGMSMISPYKIVNGKVQIDVLTGEPVMVTNEVGWVDPIDFEDLYSKVARHMVDVPHEHMQSKMAMLATLDDDFARLQYYLEERKSKSDGFFASFYSFFANTQYGFIVVDNSKGRAKVIIANATSVDNVLADKWRDNANIYEDFNDDNDDPIVVKSVGVKLQKDLNAIGDKMDEDAKKSKKSGTVKNKQKYVNMAKPILKELGMSISDQAWETAIINNSNGKTKLAKLLFGDGKNTPSLDLLLRQIAKGVNVYDNEKSSINRFVDLQADFEMDYYTGTFMNGKNQSVYSINLEAYNTMKMARFRDPLTAQHELAEYENDEYFVDPNADRNAKYRNLILDNVRKYIGAKSKDKATAAESMEIFEMDSYKPDWGDAKEYTETSTVDAFTIRYIMFGAMEGSETFFANTGTKSDKGRSQWMRVKKLDRPLIAAALRKVFDAEAARIRRMQKMQDELNRLDAVAADETASQAERDQAVEDRKDLKTKMEIKGYWDTKKPENSPALNFQTFANLETKNRVPITPDTHSADLSATGISDVDKMRLDKEINDAIEVLMDRVIDANLQEMERLGILSHTLDKDGKRVYSTTDQGGGGFGTSGITAEQADLDAFILNDFIWATEYARLFNGDQAFYEDLNVYFKRGYQSITPGNQPLMDKDYEVAKATRRTHMSLALVNDVYKVNTAEAVHVWAAPYDETLTIEDTERIIEKLGPDPITNAIKLKAKIDAEFPNISETRRRAIHVINGYRMPNKTDGQAWCSINFYRDLMNGMNRWSEQQEEYWLNAWSKHKTIEEALKDKAWVRANGETVALTDRMRKTIREGVFANAPQPLKPFYWGERNHVMGKGEQQESMLIFEQFKCSIKPVTPDLAAAFVSEGREEGFTTFSDLYDRVNGINQYKGKPIDVVAHDSGMKVGVYGSVEPSQMSESVVRSMPLSNLRFPQNIDSKTKEEANLGSQMAKLVVANMAMEANYMFQSVNRTGEWMHNSYHGAWGELIRRSTSKLKKELGLNAESVEDWSLPDDYESRIKFFRNLANLLRETNLERDLPEMYDEILRITRMSAATDAQIQPYAASLDFPPIARRYETILMALFRNRILRQKFPGTSMVQVADYGTKTSDELKFIKKNGDRYVAAEVAIPYKMAVKILGEDIGYGGVQTVLDNMINNDPINGRERAIQARKALKILGYRIPTQGKNSMLPMKIAKILSPAEGMSIIVPGEITTQMGSDFDIDKMYLMFPSVEQDAETKNWVKSDYKNMLGKDEPSFAKEDGWSDKHLKNFLLDMSFSILLDPKHITETLAPLDVTLMDEKIKDYKLDQGNKNHMYGSMHTNIYYESINKFAKIAVGATANSITGQSFFPTIKPGVAFDTKKYAETGKKEYNFHINLKQGDDNRHNYMFDAITTFAGEFISDTLKMLNNAALDNAKDPKLGKLNLNNTTLGTAMLLAVSRFDATYIFDFVNQPILRAFAEFVENSNVRNIDQNRNEFIKSLGERYVSLNENRPAKKPEIDITKIGDEASLEADTLDMLTDEEAAFQIEILHEFISYSKPSRELSKIFRQLSPETAKEMSSFASLELYEYGLEDFGGGYFTFANNPFITDSAQRTSEFYHQGWGGARNLASLLYPYFSGSYRGLKSQIAELQQMKMTDFTKKQLDRINGLLGLHRVGRDVDLSRKVFDPEKWKPLLFDKKKSLMAKILKVQARLKKEGRLQGNYLLRELQIAPFYIQSGAWTQLITFNNTAKRSREQKNRISQSWRDMLNSTDPEIREIAELLPIYNILVNGFQAGPRDMTEMVPLSFWENSGILDQYMNSMTPATLADDKIFYEGDNVLEDILLNGATELIPKLRGFYTKTRVLKVSERKEIKEKNPDITEDELNKIIIDEVIVGKKDGEENVLIAGQHYIMDPKTKAITRLTIPASKVPGILMTNNRAPTYIKLSHDKKYHHHTKGWVANKKKSRDRFYKLTESIELEEGGYEYQYDEIQGRGEDYMFYHMDSWGIGETYYPKYDDKQLFAEPTSDMDAAAELMRPEGDVGMPGAPDDLVASLLGGAPSAGIDFQESPSSGYRERTMKNASADATIALAIDFNSAGERLTKKSVLQQGKQYIPIPADELVVTEELINSVVDQLNEANAKTLNIAGNGIYTLKGKYTQSEVDQFTYELLDGVLNSPNLENTIESIRSGGQTGFDEAGAKASMRLGVQTIVLAPKGWKFRNAQDKDISSKEQFIARFDEVNKQAEPSNVPDNMVASLFGKKKKGDKPVTSSEENNTPNQPPVDESLIKGMFDKTTKKSSEEDPMANISKETPEELRLKEETKTKLLASLSAMGVSAEVVDDMMERYGIDAYGVANFANMSINLAKGNRGWNSLPEEIAHFFVRGLKGRPAFEELLNAAKGTKEYQQVVEEYGALYNYDERRMLEEAAGKIIANRIFQQEEMGTLARILNRIKRIILNVFGKADPLETAALDILRGNVEEFGGSEGVMFNKGTSFEDMLNSLHGDISTSEHAGEAGAPFISPKEDVDTAVAASKIDVEILQQAFMNAEINSITKDRMDLLIKRMQKDIKKKYKYARSVKDNTNEHVRRMKSLVQALDTMDMAVFIETLAEQSQADMAYISKRVKALSNKVGGNMEGRITEINKLKDTLSIYDPMSEFAAVLSQIIEGQGTLGMEPLVKVIDNALGGHAKLKQSLLLLEHQNVTQLVQEKADPSITKEEIIESIYRPKKDINWFNKTLFGLADSTDLLLSFIGAEMLRAVKRARVAFNNYLNGTGEQVGLRSLDAALRNWSSKSNPYEDLIEINEKTDKYEFVKAGSAKYDEIMSLPEDHPLRAYYEGAVMPYVNARVNIPRFLRGGSEYNIPVVKATGFETKRVRTYVEEAVDNFRITGEEEEHYDPSLAYVRYRYNSNLPSKYVSMEITTSLSEAMKDIYYANERRKVEPLFKSVVAMAKFRQYSNKTMFSKSEAAGEKARANEKVENIAKAFLYEGSYEAVEADIPEPIKKALKKVGVSMEENEKLNMTKFAFAMKGVMTMINLGMNIPGQIVNVITQFVYIMMEGLGGRNYTIPQLMKGLFRISTAGPRMALDYNTKRPSSKESLLLERLGIFEDSAVHNNKVLYNSKGNLFNGFLRRLAFLGFKLGNSISHPTIAFAMMDNIKFKTSKGEISYFDAWEKTSTNGLRLNKEVAEQLKEKYGSIEEGIFKTEEPIRRESLRISDIHEVYDRGTAQNSIVGAFVMMYRSWFGPLALNLFGTYRRDPITGKREQGFINTFVTSVVHGMMRKDVKTMKMIIPWMNNLSEKDINPYTGKNFTKDEITMHKANIKKAYAMVAFTLLTAFMVDDEDEEELIKSDPFKLYVFLRVRSEVLALLNPKDIYRIAQSPTAAIGLVEKFTDIAGYYTWDFSKGGEELESGFWEGYTRRGKAISQVIPVYNQYLSLQHLEDRIKFLSK